MKKLNSELFKSIDLSNVKGGIIESPIGGTTKTRTYFTQENLESGTQDDWKSERGTFQDYSR